MADSLYKRTLVITRRVLTGLTCMCIGIDVRVSIHYLKFEFANYVQCKQSCIQTAEVHITSASAQSNQSNQQHCYLLAGKYKLNFLNGKFQYSR